MLAWVPAQPTEQARRQGHGRLSVKESGPDRWRWRILGSEWLGVCWEGLSNGRLEFPLYSVVSEESEGFTAGVPNIFGTAPQPAGEQLLGPPAHPSKDAHLQALPLGRNHSLPCTAAAHLSQASLGHPGAPQALRRVQSLLTHLPYPSYRWGSHASSQAPQKRSPGPQSRLRKEWDHAGCGTSASFLFPVPIPRPSRNDTQAASSVPQHSWVPA